MARERPDWTDAKNWPEAARKLLRDWIDWAVDDAQAGQEVMRGRYISLLVRRAELLEQSEDFLACEAFKNLVGVSGDVLSENSEVEA